VIAITDAQVKKTLRQVVSERPEFVYDVPENGFGCMYVHANDGDPERLVPGCVVGVVLNRIGVPLEKLSEHEGKSAGQIVRLFLTGISRSTVSILDDIQQEQDDGEPWGSAYAHATGETI